MSEEETMKDERINAARVADLWNERSRLEKNVESHYTRFSVRSRREELEGEHTVIGWLYSKQKALKVPLRPRSSRRPDRAEANKTPFKRRDEISDTREYSSETS